MTKQAIFVHKCIPFWALKKYKNRLINYTSSMGEDKSKPSALCLKLRFATRQVASDLLSGRTAP